MKIFKISKTSIRVYITTLLSVFLLIGVSFAWYYSKVSLGGGGLSTGNIDFVAYGYDENGTLKSTMIPDGKSTSGYSNVNASIFAKENWKAGDASTAYISVERKGSIDIEFNVSFSASGADNVEANFMHLGGYWYEITEITSLMTAQNDSSLATYAAANKVILCSETQCPNNKHTCTEKDGVGNYKNMSSILTTTTQGVIKKDDTIQKRYYRIDYGVRKDATPSEYTNKKIELFAQVYVTQVGAIQNPDGIGIEYTVTTEAELKQAIIDSVPGDTIVFAADITYTGDLIINKALNLNLTSKTLTVKGNFTYNFTSAHTLKINLTGLGTIKVLMNGQGGGNFTFDTPNAQIEIIGSNTNGDLIVERNLTVSASNDPDKGGCVLSGVTIKDTVNESKEIYLKSDTKVTISNGCVIKRLEARAQANNIQIVNNGIIDALNLGSMFYSTMTDFPQIYIINHGVINGIVLPTWSEVFKENNGQYTGNTKIVCYGGSVLNNLTEVNGFKSYDVIYEGSSILVESVDGSYERLRINYKNRTGSETTIQGLLEEYFSSENFASNAIAGCISNIKYLEINAISGKYITEADISYFNSGNLNNLQSINLQNANLIDNTLKTNFITINSLREVVLPKNLQIIQGRPFGKDANIREIYVPETVIDIAYEGLMGVRYAYFTSTNIPIVHFPSSSNDQYKILRSNYIFVTESEAFKYEIQLNSYSEYDNPVKQYDYTWGVLQNPCYPISTLADDGVSFVRKLDDGTYELVLLDLGGNPNVIKNNEYVVGQNVTINNEPIVISKLGRYALFKNEFPNLSISFADSITTSGYKSLADAIFYSVDFSNVQTFGKSTMIYTEVEKLKFSNTERIDMQRAFYDTSGKYLDLGSVTYIHGECFLRSDFIEVNTGIATYLNSSSFKECTSLKRVDAPNVVEIRSEVFKGCTSLYEVRMPVVQTMSKNVFNGDNKLMYLHLGDQLKSVAVETLDGTPALKFLYMGYNKTLSLNRLNNSNPVIDYIFVHSSQYSKYCKSDSIMKDSIRVYGEVVGDYEINAGTVNDPYYVNVGEYTVAATGSGYVHITACHYQNEDIDDTYKLPSKLPLNGVDTTITVIGKRAFYNLDVAFTSFNSVSTIYEYAFYNCDNLKVISSLKIKTINGNAFNGCDNLTTLNLPKLASLSNDAFSNCPSLTSIYLETALTTTGTSCFAGTTTNIKTITINNSALVASTQFSQIASKDINLCVLSTIQSEYLNDSVFSKFNIVAIDSTATDSKNNVFFLRKIENDDLEIVSIKYVSATMAIPNSNKIVRSVEGVFDYLPITTLTLPNTYKSVNEDEFSKIIGLQTLKVNSKNTNFTAVNGVLYSLVDGNYNELICYPNAKKDVEFTVENAKAISSGAFKNVKHLKSLILPTTLEAIGENSFENSSINSFTFNATTPPYLTSSNIFNTEVEGFVIKVPSAQLNTYKNSTGFVKYAEYIIAN